MPNRGCQTSLRTCGRPQLCLSMSAFECWSEISSRCVSVNVNVNVMLMRRTGISACCLSFRVREASSVQVSSTAPRNPPLHLPNPPFPSPQTPVRPDLTYLRLALEGQAPETPQQPPSPCHCCSPVASRALSFRDPQTRTSISLLRHISSPLTHKHTSSSSTAIAPPSS